MGVDRDGPMTETTLSGDGGQADGIFLLANDTAVSYTHLDVYKRQVVAPSQTLGDKEYQMLRSSALNIITELGITGGCNVCLLYTSRCV